MLLADNLNQLLEILPKFVSKPPPVQGRSVMPGAYGEKPFILRDEDKEL